MPVFIVVARERFTTRTTYIVEAATSRDALRQCQEGTAAYDKSEPEDVNGDWLETVSVTKQGDSDVK